MTNGDRIRQMSDEELVELIGKTVQYLDICVACPAFLYCKANGKEEEYASRRGIPDCRSIFSDWLSAEVDEA